MPDPVSPTHAARLIGDLRSLLEVTTADAAVAEQQWSTDSASGDTARDRATEELEAHLAEASTNEQELHESSLAEIKSQYRERTDHANQQYQGRQVEIAAEAKTIRSTARKNLKEQEWLAESVFEAAGQEPAKRLQLTREELQRNEHRISQLDEQADRFRLRCRMNLPVAPDSAEAPPTDSDPEVALQRLRDQVDTCEQSLRRLHALVLPRCFIGPVPFVIVCGGAVLGWAIAAGLLQTMSSGPIADHAINAIWGSGIGVVTTVMAMFALHKLAARQFTLRNADYRTHIALAHAISNDIDRVGESNCTLDQDAHRDRRDREIQNAQDTIAPKLEQVAPRQERREQKLEDNYQGLVEKIETRHTEKLAEEQERHATVIALLNEEETLGRAEIQRVWNDSVGVAKGEHEAVMERLIATWTTGTNAFRDALQSITEQHHECVPPWNDPTWSSFQSLETFNGLIHYGAWTVDLATLSTAGLPPAANFPLPMDQTIELPAMLHLPRSGSLFLEFAEHGREHAVQVLQSTMLRLLASLPAGKVRFTVIDPVGLGQSFAGFMHLADHEEARILEKIWTEPRHIEQQLTDLTEHMENVIQTYLRNEYETIDEYNLAAGQIAEPYRYLIIADMPVNLSENAGKRLTSIMQTGARCGVYTLIACDTRQSMPRDVMREDLVEHSQVLQMNEDGWHAEDPALANLPLSLDQSPPEEQLTRIVRHAGDAAEASRRVEVPFDMIMPKAEDHWTGSTAKELRVSIGQTGATRHQHLVLGRGTSQHALVAGKTGSGKSTLLHVLITNLALWYSPDEVVFYLVDFKKGVEFKTYAQHELPHARVIAIESDREFGLSVLQRIDQELKERGERFRDLGVQDLAAFRASTGEPLPRILLVVDEFQELFVDDDKLSQDASLLLDRLVRQGRAFGIHALLGSQTLDGAYSLARSTLGQMGVRIALQCTEADSYLILSEENAAARLLERPGEAIYNDAGGKVEGNNPFQVCWLDDAIRDDALGMVRALSKSHDLKTPAPFIFEGNIPANLSECIPLKNAMQASTPGDGQLTGWLGDAIAIKDPTAFTLQSHSGANVLVVGQREETATAQSLALMLGMAAQQHAPAECDEPGVCFYLLDGLPADSSNAGKLAAFGEQLPHRVISGTHRDTEAIINELGAILGRRRDDGEEEGARVVLFLHGLHRLRKLRRDEDDFSFSSGDDDSPAKPDQILGELLKDGPTHGIHVVAWIDTLNNLNRTLDRNGQREFEMRVLFQMSANDSSHLIDSPVAANLGLQRALYNSEDTGIQEKFRPWAMPEDQWLNEQAATLRARS